jgi:type I restriction enzyme M protein
MDTAAIVESLRGQAAQLRQSGLSEQEFATELAYLLFLKLLDETDAANELPDGYRWKDLTAKQGTEQRTFYSELLLRLGTEGSARVKPMFASSSTRLDSPRTLHKLVTDIDALDWFAAREQGGLAKMYEGLLEAHASNAKSKSGGYFTPRALIQAMVRVVKPQPGEVVQDPAAGTGGFLIAADAYIQQETDGLSQLSRELAEFQVHRAFVGLELEPRAHRPGLMNMMLHGTSAPLELTANIRRGNTLTREGIDLGAADVILTNPPFGATRGGGKPARDDFTFPTSDWPLSFLQHVYRSLRLPRSDQPGGRAAVVVPDNVLFNEQNGGIEIRRDLMEKCNLHTILRLPADLFANGTKTNVLFFHRGARDTGSTTSTSIYDLRTNVPSFGKRNPMLLEHFADFLRAHGDDPYGRSARSDDGVTGRFRRFSREDIARLGDNLNITWLRDESQARAEDLPDPDAIAEQIAQQLEDALGEMKALREILAEK